MFAASEAPVRRPRPAASCWHCRDPDAALRCGRCRRARYCRPACHRAAWPKHRLECATSSAATGESLQETSAATWTCLDCGNATLSGRAVCDWCATPRGQGVARLVASSQSCPATCAPSEIDVADALRAAPDGLGQALVARIAEGGELPGAADVDPQMDLSDMVSTPCSSGDDDDLGRLDVPDNHGPWEAGGFTFFASFDSGNCLDVSLAASSGASPLVFDVLPRADCEGTEFEQADRQWFCFGMHGTFEQGEHFRFRILNLSRFRGMSVARARLSVSGLLPVVQHTPKGCAPVVGKWAPVTKEAGFDEVADGRYALVFDYTVRAPHDGDMYFAYTYPYPLECARASLRSFQRRLASQGAYAHREEIARTLEGRPVELFTFTAGLAPDGDTEGVAATRRQPPLRRARRPPEAASRCCRPRVFLGRQAVFVSARVHPGEAPASYVLEGLLELLASGSSVGQALLERYVFFVVPVLNPDGVALGLHRSDTRGENLNRVYGAAASPELHPSICAAEEACLLAHRHQGGLRLYLDLHAHSTRRAAFLLSDPPAGSLLGERHADDRLFAYALARRCSMFEYAQCDFKNNAPATGKSAIACATGVPLCFTVETHYHRGHHSTEPFSTPTWARLGASLLEALLDLDDLRSPPRLAMPRADRERRLAELRAAAAALAEEGAERSVAVDGPSRAQPLFGVVEVSSEGRPPSRALLRNPELVGRRVEVIGCEPIGRGNTALRFRLHECDGGGWIEEADLRMTVAQQGEFRYGALRTIPVTSTVDPSSEELRKLGPGAVVEACERKVFDGILRVGLVQGGWASEHVAAAFDPRLGGQAQLLRLPPRRAAHMAMRR